MKNSIFIAIVDSRISILEESEIKSYITIEKNFYLTVYGNIGETLSGPLIDEIIYYLFRNQCLILE